MNTRTINHLNNDFSQDFELIANEKLPVAERDLAKSILEKITEHVHASYLNGNDPITSIKELEKNIERIAQQSSEKKNENR